MEKHAEETFFEAGDIVCEGPLISTNEKSPFIGVVVKVEVDYFLFNEDYIIVEEVGRRIQDRVTVFWFTHSYIETLPEDLLKLISRNSHKKTI